MLIVEGVEETLLIYVTSCRKIESQWLYIFQFNLQFSKYLIAVLFHDNVITFIN